MSKSSYEFKGSREKASSRTGIDDKHYHQYREAGDDETPCGSRAGLPGAPPLTSPGAHPGCSAPGAWP
ncbi:hypothetical protein LDY98_16675, partial [Pseudomonas aeruginosa]|nr:hypothetical protein [Pseudomonas aeruginosa]